jgi:hypothetical protein
MFGGESKKVISCHQFPRPTTMNLLKKGEVKTALMTKIVPNRG